MLGDIPILTLHKMVRSFWLSRCISTLKAPLGPRTLTVNCPAPAPRVSQINRDWNVAKTPCSIPFEYKCPLNYLSTKKIIKISTNLAQIL
jgi:hypothetical protein